MLRLFTVWLSLLVALSSAFAQDAKRIVGVWKLVSFHTEFQDGRPKIASMGANPIGHQIFTAEGRMMAMLEAEGRQPGHSDEDATKLLRTMIAFTGLYRVEGEHVITKVDATWSPGWRGTDQVRTFKVDGDRLDVISSWGPFFMLPGNPMARGVLVYERVRQ